MSFLEWLNKAFMYILEYSIYAAVIAFVVFIIRALFAKRFPAMFSYALWGIVLIRLLIPVSLPLPTIIDFSKAQDKQDIQTPDESDAVTGSLQNIDYDWQTTTDNTQNLSQNIKSENKMNPTSSNPTQQYSFDPSLLLGAMWLLGVAVLLSQTVILYLLTRRRLNTAVPLNCHDLGKECAAMVGIRCAQDICMSGQFHAPVLFGILRPKIILPVSAKDMSETQLKHVLLHEMVHKKRGDMWLKALWSVVLYVNWFNPVLWFADRLYSRDMERACDEKVISLLGMESKKAYALSLLNVALNSSEGAAAGKAIAFAKGNMKRRIEGVLSLKKISKAATALSLVIVLCLSVVLLAACQPTPEEVIVVGKGDGLSDLIQATPSASSNVSPSESAQTNDALYTKLAAPKHWSLETTALAEKLNITADVDIELPGVSQLPAATAKLSEFTQEDLDKIVEVLGVGDAVWTQVDYTMTKEQIQQEILDHKARRAEYEAKGDYKMVEKMDEDLEDYAQMYIDAPDEIVLKNIEFKIGEISYGEDLISGDKQTVIGFEGTTKIDEQPFYFYAGSDVNSNSVNRVYANFGTHPASFGGVDVDAPYGVSLTKEQAAEQASEIAAQLTDELTLCYITPAGNQQDISRNWGWACVFMREIYGCPTAYETAERGFRLEAVNVPVNYEKMIIVIDDAGMMSFEWCIPMTIESIDNPDVSLLSFDEISQRAIDQIAQRFADSVSENIDSDGIDWGDPGCTAAIIKAELGLMRIEKPNSTDYYYIPVWKFFVDIVHTEDYYQRTGSVSLSTFLNDHSVDEHGNPMNTNFEYNSAVGINVITINAIDGSAIDPYVGY